MNNTIDISNLNMFFGKYPALTNVNLEVKNGSAMALLGENGAGKTTTLRIIAGIYQAHTVEGSALELPIGTDKSEFFQQLGYVSENQQLPLRWTLQRYINYLKPLYPTWDDNFCAELVDNFEMPLDRKLGAMSRGMQMKAALIGALSYRPKLLLLDEPFSGLDPLVREELIDGILELMDEGDWTILLSSHDIHEVERLCDSVTFIEYGHITISESLDSLQTRFRKWTVQSETPPTPAPDWILVKQLSENSWTFTETQHEPEHSLERITQAFGSIGVHESHELSLRDIYLAMAKEKKQRRRRSA